MKERIVQQPVATEVQEKFTDLPTADTERSTFDMSHPWKGTMDSKYIVPCMLQEVLPGDTFNIKSTAFMRLATPLRPIMDSVTADIHYFFVPNRILWDNWQAFMGERKNPSDDPTLLSVPLANIPLDLPRVANTLQDYFGLPLVTANPGQATVQVNALPFRGYYSIWNEWFRNQNLTPEKTFPTGNGPDNSILFGYPDVVQPRHKRGDYFTKALPWPQKGDAVFLPLGTNAPVYGVPGQDIRLRIGTSIQQLNRIGVNNVGDARGLKTETLAGDTAAIRPARWDDQGPHSLYADLSVATAATINDIRTAFQIQKLLERDARGGTRYIEILLSHFNVTSPDYRLQRPEYIGGGSARIIINPVASTVETNDAPQGNLSAVGTGLVNAGMHHSFTEHGFLYCLISCRADLTYQNGIDRFWKRRTRYDYYWPALSHLGEQPIYNEELFYNHVNTSGNRSIWGYQERYAEYRYQPGRVTGLFRSNVNASLDSWHLAQDFNALPFLDTNFVVEDPPIDRVIAVPSEPHFLVDIWHNCKATRVMPVYAVPGLVDHF